jgi:transmembrane sensor
MQKRNSYKKLEDFLFDESFQRWVKFNEDPSHWEEWTLENTERAKLVEEARLWILAMKVEETPISNKETQIALQKTWESINVSRSHSPIKVTWQSNWFRSAAAILVIGLASLVYFFVAKSETNITITYQELVQQDADGLIEQANNSDKPQLITLSDASSVLLQPKSKLSYPKTFNGNERKVYLSGEGFFEISKDPKKPFYVYANEVVTKVYGTSFRVIAYANQANVEVLVRTGKVKVSSNKNVKNATAEEVMLLPNQAARFVRKELSFEKILDITQDKPLLATTNTIEQLSFEFKDIPVHQIFKTIEQAYLVRIDFPTEKLKDCYLTTSLSDEPLPEKLKIICESLGNNTRYEMNGNQITILSNGCN